MLEQLGQFQSFDPMRDGPDSIQMILATYLHTRTMIIIKLGEHGEKGARLISIDYDIFMPPIHAFNKNILEDY